MEKRDFTEQTGSVANLRDYIDLDTLLSVDSDPIRYQRQPGDEETPALMSMADLKELLLAINVSSRRIYHLLEDVQRAEARIDDLDPDIIRPGKNRVIALLRAIGKLIPIVLFCRCRHLEQRGELDLLDRHCGCGARHAGRQ